MKKVIICIAAGFMLAFGAIIAAKHLLKKDDDKSDVEYVSEDEIVGI